MKNIALFFLTISLCFSVSAKQVEGLYKAKILVPNQSAASHLQGAKSGLIEVLHKVSGYDVPIEHPVIARALNIADQYLYQFSFTRVSEEERIAGVDIGSSWMNMQFEGKTIQRIVRQAKLPRWGNNRPTMMVWMAMDDGNRTLMTDGLEHVGVKALEDGARKRGLPLILPVYDLEDSIKLPMEQLWGLFSDRIKDASKRYGAESVLAARVFETDPGSWVGHWRFYFRGQEYEYHFTGTKMEDVVLMGLTASGSVLADAFALKPSNEKRGVLTIDVERIDSLEGYAGVTNYLQRLAITKQVSLIKAKGSTLELELALNGSLDQLKQTLALDKKLVVKKLNQESAEEDEFDSEVRPVFIWRP